MQEQQQIFEKTTTQFKNEIKSDIKQLCHDFKTSIQEQLNMFIASKQPTNDSGPFQQPPIDLTSDDNNDEYQETPSSPLLLGNVGDLLSEDYFEDEEWLDEKEKEMYRKKK